MIIKRIFYICCCGSNKYHSQTEKEIEKSGLSLTAFLNDLLLIYSIVIPGTVPGAGSKIISAPASAKEDICNRRICDPNSRISG